MRRIRGVLVAAVAVAVLGLAAVPAALADGLPEPLPGATGGPGAAAFVDLVKGYGLACQPDQSTTGRAEWSCVRDDPTGALILSATFYADPVLVLVAFASATSPMPADGVAFVRELSAPFCPASAPGAVGTFIETVRAANDPAGSTFDDASCRLQLGGQDTAGRAVLAMTAFAKSATGAASTPAPGSSPGVPAAGGGGRTQTTFAAAIPGPGGIATDPAIVLQSAVLAALLVLLIPFPSQLFNSTLEEHYDEVRHWFRLDRLSAAGGRIGGFWRTPPGIAAFVILAGLIYAFLDPTLGPDAAGLGEVVGLVAGLVIVTAVAAVPAWLTGRAGRGGVRLRALPATLVVGLVCVAISRLTEFQPGYVYGVILGLEFARPIETRDTARLNAVTAALGLALALAAWFGLDAIRTADSGFAAAAIQTALAAVLVAGLEGVVFGLLPLRFLPGEPLFRTSRIAWAALLGVGAFAFFHILLNPTSGYLADSSRTPLFTIVVLLLGFGAVSVGFWGYFRFRPARD